MDSPLSTVGLSDAEAAVYEALLAAPPSTAEELARELSLDVAAVRRAAGRLVQLGLASGSEQRPRRFRAVDPDVALSGLISQKEAELREVRTHEARLSQLFERSVAQRDPDSLIELLHGRDVILEREKQFERAAKREIKALDMPPYHDAGIEPNQGELDFLARGGRVRAIYATEGLTEARLPLFESWVQAGEEARTMSTLPMKIVIFDDERAFMPLRPRGQETPSPTFVIVRPSAILSGLVAMFEMLWDRAVPVGLQRPVADAKNGLDETDSQLIGYLTAGVSDEVAARRLGISPRTVQRRLTALMDRYHCSSRFQLALAMARDGLLP